MEVPELRCGRCGGPMQRLSHAQHIARCDYCGFEGQVPAAAMESTPAERPKHVSRLDLDIGGERWTLVRSQASWRVTEPWAGHVELRNELTRLVDSDDTEIARAVRTDYGFKLRRGERQTARVVTEPGRIRVKVGTGDAEIGRFDAGGGRLGGESVQVVADAADWVVRRGAERVARASRGLSAEAATLLALTEVSAAERVTALVHLLESR